MLCDPRFPPFDDCSYSLTREFRALNTPAFLESDPLLSEDRTTFFFASTRTGVADIHQAEVLSYE